MKIDEAILKLRSEMSGSRLSSKKAGMYRQTESTILFWLLFDTRSSEAEKNAVKTLKKILSADDWQLEKE